jgi:hypothetical protein
MCSGFEETFIFKIVNFICTFGPLNTDIYRRMKFQGRGARGEVCLQVTYLGHASPLLF